MRDFARAPRADRAALFKEAVTDEHLRFRQELVNFGRALLEAT